METSITHNSDGMTTRVAPQDTEIYAADTDVMPGVTANAPIPAEVQVMPIPHAQPQSNLLPLVKIANKKLSYSRPEMKKLGALSVGLLAILTGSLLLPAIATKELRAEDTSLVRSFRNPELASQRAYQQRRERVRRKLDFALNRELDSLTHDRFIKKWSFVTVYLDKQGLTAGREDALISPHGYVYDYNAATRIARIALPTRYLVTAAQLSFVEEVSVDTERFE